MRALIIILIIIFIAGCVTVYRASDEAEIETNRELKMEPKTNTSVNINKDTIKKR